MPQSKQPAPVIGYPSPVSLIGIATCLLLWLLLIWCIWQVSNGLF
jgi:hypothetical protein